MFKKLIFVNLFLLTFCFSHQQENAVLNISVFDEKSFKIEILDSRTKKEIFFNQAKIISSKNTEIIKEFLLSKDNQVINLPSHKYTVLVKVGNRLLYKQNTFYKTFFIFVSCFIFFISLVIYKLRIKKYVN